MDNDDDIYGEPSPQMPLSAKIKQENDMQEDEVEVDSEEDIWLCSCSSVGHLTVSHGPEAGRRMLKCYLVDHASG